MISLKNLREDRQAELTDKPFFDLVNCTPIQIIGTYHDIDDKVIVWDINTVDGDYEFSLFVDAEEDGKPLLELRRIH